MTVTAKAAEREAEPKHTPGPWVVQPCDATGSVFVVAGAWPLGSTVCDVDEEPREGAGACNARLIAAAPDMLWALHTARITIGSYIGAGLNDPATLRAFKKINEVIDQAEGQS